jgi:hypothetical protein
VRLTNARRRAGVELSGVAYHHVGQFENAALCYKAALDKDLTFLRPIQPGSCF